MKYKLGIIIGIIGILGVVFGFGIQKVKANPSYFLQSSGTASATSTGTYMSAGNATTTETLDSFTGTFQGVDSAALLVQLTGSSTASVINIAIERSQDGNDWYADTYITTASSSPNAITLNNLYSYSLTYASTTVGGAAGTTGNLTRVINVPTPTRYTRAVITMPSGSTRGQVWQKFIGKRQTSY